MAKEQTPEELEDAISKMTTQIEKNPDDTKAYYNRGIAKGKLSRHEEAIADFDKAIELNPDSAPAYSNRGTAKSILGRHKKAIANYDKALQLDHNHKQAIHNRAVAMALLDSEQERAEIVKQLEQEYEKKLQEQLEEETRGLLGQLVNNQDYLEAQAENLRNEKNAYQFGTPSFYCSGALGWQFTFIA